MTAATRSDSVCLLCIILFQSTSVLWEANDTSSGYAGSQSSDDFKYTSYCRYAMPLVFLLESTIFENGIFLLH